MTFKTSHLPAGAYRSKPDAFQVVSMLKSDTSIAAHYWAKHHVEGNAPLAKMCARNVAANLERIRLYGGQDIADNTRAYVRGLADTRLKEFRAALETRHPVR